MQSAVSGGAVGVLGVAVGVAARSLWSVSWPVVDVLTVSACAGCVVGVVAWFRLLADSRDLLRDWEGAAAPVDPQPAAAGSVDRLEVTTKHGDGRRVAWSIDRLDVSRDRLERIAKGYFAGRVNLSRRGLADCGIGSDKARALMSELEEHAFLSYPQGRRHPDGAQLTSKGAALFKGLAGGGLVGGWDASSFPSGQASKRGGDHAAA